MAKKDEKTKKAVKPVEPQTGTRGVRMSEEGIVVSDLLSLKNNKTVTVRLERLVPHPRFKKYIRRHKKMLAHDEKNECRMGDRVEVILVPPISKTKRWKVTKVLERAK